MSDHEDRGDDRVKEQDTNVISLGADRGDYDVFLEGARTVLRDRWTGEEYKLKKDDVVIFGDEAFNADQLRTLYSPSDLIAVSGLRSMVVNTSEPTISVLWDQLAQDLVAKYSLGPTVSTYIYSVLHTAIYDAWASFDPFAARVSIDLEHDNIAFNSIPAKLVIQQDVAMNLAAHHVLKALFPADIDQLNGVMDARLDIEMHDVSRRVLSIAIDAAEDVLSLRMADFARFGAGAPSNYQPLNASSAIEDRVDIARWSPSYKVGAAEGSGALQKFLTPEWYQIEGFALPHLPDGTTDFSTLRPDPNETFFVSSQATAILDVAARSITLASDVQVGDMYYSAGAVVPVTKSLIGAVINPAFIAQAEHIVSVSANLTTQQKMSAEFWEDGLGTSYPPGAALTLAQFVSQRDGHDNAADAKMFMIMSNALLDAGIATWDAKIAYDSARPITVIRDLGALGLIGEPGIDEITGETGYVIRAYAGIDPLTGEGLGTRTILAENFISYQLPAAYPSPPFAEHTSGHSAFSAAAAEVLRLFTGSDSLDASIFIPAGSSDFDSSLPVGDSVLSFGSFTEYALSAGQSRIYGGIHFENGNIGGLSIGQSAGAAAFDLGQQFINGSAVASDRPFYYDFSFA